MDTVLLVITVVSLVAAFASIMGVRKLKHADQLRSDARVAALMAAADNTDTDTVPVHVEPQPRPVTRKAGAASTDGTWSSVAGEWQWNPEPAGIRESGVGIGSARMTERIPNPESRIPSSASPITSSERSDLFGTVRREEPASGRFAFAAGLALIVALGGAVVVFTTSSHEKTAASATRAPRANPLELVSLGHSRDASLLTINGVVRNPSNGPKLEGLTAVVSLIDEHGAVISTKDVPLDYRALGPGEEAPFKVSVPDPGSIARYRVSFRAGTDVVPHVDRRTDTKLASAL